MMEENEPLASMNFEFENQENSILKCRSSNYDFFCST